MPWQRDFSKIPPVKASSVSKPINQSIIYPSVHSSVHVSINQSIVYPSVHSSVHVSCDSSHQPNGRQVPWKEVLYAQVPQERLIGLHIPPMIGLKIRLSEQVHTPDLVFRPLYFFLGVSSGGASWNFRHFFILLVENNAIFLPAGRPAVTPGTQSDSFAFCFPAGENRPEERRAGAPPDSGQAGGHYTDPPGWGCSHGHVGCCEAARRGRERVRDRLTPYTDTW